MSHENRPVQEFEISDALWARIAPLLPERIAPVHPLGCHRQRVCDRKVFNSIFYLLRTGGQWKGLSALDPSRYARSSTAHDRFQEWLGAGFFARLWEASVWDFDELVGLDFEWMAMDGAMTKAPLGGEKSGPCPCDRGKSGVKRVPVTDAQGIVVGLCVEGANRHDMKLTREALESLPASLAAKRDEWVFGAVEVLDDAALDEAVARVQEPGWEPDLEAPQREVGLCLDKGYDYQEVREVVTALGYTAHIRTRGEEQVAKAAGQKARRWVVERTHSWLNRFRRLLVRWEKKGANYLAFLHFACALITWNKALSG